MGDEPKDPPEEEDRGGSVGVRPRGPKYTFEEPPPPSALDRMTPRHVHVLATLVKKYDAAVVAKAAKIVVPRERGRPRLQMGGPDFDRMTVRDCKLLATLLKKYGAAVVAKAAKIVALRKRGRPRLEIGGAYYDRMALADLFDELVEEHRAAGSRHPKKAAMRELFLEIAHPSFNPDPEFEAIRERFKIARPSGNPDDAFRRFTRTTQRKLPQGRRDLKAVLERAAAIEQHQLSGSKKPRKRRAKKSRE
jgi:hypothetical protein